MHSHPSFLSLPISGQVDCTFPLPAAWAKPFGVSLDSSLSFISYIHLVRNTYQFYFQSTSRIQARLSISATTWSQLPTIPPGLRQTPPPPPAPTLTPYTLFSTQCPKWCCKDIQHCHSSAQKSPMASLLFHMEDNVLIMASQTQRGLSPAHLLPSSYLTSFPTALALAQRLQLLGLSLLTLPGAGPASVLPGSGTVWGPFLQAQGWPPPSFSLSKRAPSDLFQTELPSPQRP